MAHGKCQAAATMGLFLSIEDVVELTGFKMKSKQILWLQTSGLRFFVARDGTPRIPLAELTHSSTAIKDDIEPNLDGLSRF
jgi:hypothetical protein